MRFVVAAKEGFKEAVMAAPVSRPPPEVPGERAASVLKFSGTTACVTSVTVFSSCAEVTRTISGVAKAAGPHEVRARRTVDCMQLRHW